MRTSLGCFFVFIIFVIVTIFCNGSFSVIAIVIGIRSTVMRIIAVVIVVVVVVVVKLCHHN